MLSNIDVNSVRKILIIKPRGIGDVVLSTVVLKNLRNAFLASSIDYLVEPPSEPAVKHLSDVSDVIVFDKRKTNSLKFLFDVRKRKYDLVIDLFNNPRTALITYASGARYRVGFSIRGRKYAYNIPVERDLSLHSAEHNLLPLKALGIQMLSNQVEFTIPESDLKVAKKFIQENTNPAKFLLGIGLGGGWSSKRCVPEKLAAIADALVDRMDAEVIILWGPGDKADADVVHKLMHNHSILLPPTTLLGASAFMKQCTAVIVNDSGTMHVSAATGVPTLGIFGPTNPFAHGPYGEQHEWIRNENLVCLGCNLLDCPIEHQCMTELPVEKVMSAFERLLQKNGIAVNSVIS